MIFNSSISSMQNCISISPTCLSVDKIEVKNGIYDILSMFNIAKEYSDTISKEWEDYNILLADFQDNLSGGNSKFQVKDTSALRIKRKLHNDISNSWITIYEQEIYDENSFGFVFYDRYAKAKTEYDYGLVPVFKDGTEGLMIKKTVHSNFDGIVLCDNIDMYFTEYDVKYSVQKNQLNSIVNTLAEKYPYVVHNSVADYYTGNLEGFFIGLKNCGLDFDNAIEYREGLMDFLNNRKPKILKFDDGRMWLCEVTGNSSENNSEHYLKVITSVDWTETGDSNSATDLFNAGLINKNPSDYRTNNLPTHIIPTPEPKPDPEPIPTNVDHKVDIVTSTNNIKTETFVKEYTT